MLDDPSLVSERRRGVAAHVPGVRPLPPHRDGDTELGGQQIRKGEKVVMWYVSSQSRRVPLTRIPTASTSAASPTIRRSAPAAGTSASAPRWRGSSCNVLFEETLKRYPAMELAGTPTIAESAFINQLKTLPVTLAAR